MCFYILYKDVLEKKIYKKVNYDKQQITQQNHN